MFTYVVVAFLVLLVVAAVWVQVRGRNRPGHHVSQNAPMDDTKNSWAKWQHDATQNSHTSGGGPA